MAVRTHYWTWLNHAACWGTLILWLPFLCILGVLWPAVWGMGELYGLAAQLLSRAQFWFACIFCAPGAAILLDCVVMAMQRHLRPTLSQLLQVRRLVCDCVCMWHGEGVLCPAGLC